MTVIPSSQSLAVQYFHPLPFLLVTNASHRVVSEGVCAGEKRARESNLFPDN